MDIKVLTELAKKTDRYTFVRTLMTLHNIKTSDVARALKVSNALVSRTIHAVETSRTVKKYLADKFGIDFKTLWGHEIDESWPDRKVA